MIDYSKMNLNTDNNKLLNNKTLEFVSIINSDAEILKQVTKDRYKSFHFKVIGKNAYSDGTIHKYYHNGINWNDFTFTQLNKAINQYCTEFDINPNKTSIHNIEFGVNILVPFEATVNDLRNMFLVCSNKPFELLTNNFGNAIGLVCELSQYKVKIYSKKVQCKEVKKNIVRFEVKVYKMQKIHKKTLYLYDLQKKETLNYYKAFLNKLLKKDIIVFDNSLTNLTAKEKIFIKEASNPNYWLTLNKNQRDKKKHKYNKLVLKKSKSNIKNKLIDLVKEKGDFLTNN